MYFSLDWLKELVNIPSNITQEELASKLTLHTVEIEDIKNEGSRFNNIVVGEIISIKKHPNADRLQITEVNIGEDEVLTIICGALNIKEGQKVPTALIGAVLPNNLEIKEAKVRGETSRGMLCAEDELGLGSDHSGIMILDEHAKLGQNLSEYLKLKDVIIEVDNKSLTNRPDLLNHMGIAREISAFLGTKLTKRFHKLNKDKKIKTPQEIKEININIKDTTACPRYMALKFNNIKVKESPKWLQQRLSAVDIKPINNIVDITNYTMLEIGQPMHAFDADLIDKIIVRKAKQNENITTLDGENKELTENMLVIANSVKPIAIAGVMGGDSSGVKEDTESIIFESANFESTGIRKTSKKLNLRTEASIRYEKGLDPFLTKKAINLVCKLMEEICPEAKINSELIDISTKEENFNLNLSPITVSIEWIQKRIGENIDPKKIIEILEKLFFTVENNENILTIKIPTWRATNDVSMPEDIVEEVARIYGYENIAEQKPKTKLKSPRINKKRNLERKIKNILAIGLSMDESQNYSFTSEAKVKKMNIDSSKYLKLANPLSENISILRQSLIVNLLDNIKTNQAKYNEIKFFEIGDIYMEFNGSIKKDNQSDETLPYQETRLGLVYGTDKNNNNFNKLKGELEYLLKYFDLSINFNTLEIAPSWSNDNICASINVENNEIGVIAMVNQKVLRNLGIKKEVAVAEIVFDKLLDIISSHKNILHQKQNKFPSVNRDLAFVMPKQVPYIDFKNEILNFNELITDIKLFDSYTGDKIERNKKSLAFHIIYQSQEKTLTANEINEIQEKLITTLKEKYNAIIRDF